MAVTMHTYMADVTGVTIRDVAGDGSQIELLIAGYKGLLALRCIGKGARTIRVTDLRAKDRAIRRKAHPVSMLREVAKAHVAAPSPRLVHVPSLAEQLQASLKITKTHKRGTKK